jgi:hypothetical protein
VSRESGIPSASVLVLYLSGNVPKGSAESVEPTDRWTDADEQILIERINSCQVVLLNPAKLAVPQIGPRLSYGADLYHIAASNAVVVDARGRRGLGVGAEMMFARLLGIPVVTVCPPNSAYRQDHVVAYQGQDLDDWIHPFVAMLSSAVTDSVEDAASLLDGLGVAGLATLKSDPFLDPLDEYDRERSGTRRKAASEADAVAERILTALELIDKESESTTPLSLNETGRDGTPEAPAVFTRFVARRRDSGHARGVD